MGMGEGLISAGESCEPYYDWMTKGSAVGIILPAFTFRGPSRQMSRNIYMNMCNPGTILKVSGAWIAYGEKMSEAADALRQEQSGLTEDLWSGDDAEAFHKSADEVESQLRGLAQQCMEIGMMLLAVAGFMMAYWLGVFLATTALTAMAVVYWAAKPIPGGEAVSKAMTAAAHATAMYAHVAMEAIEAKAKKPMYVAAAVLGALSLDTFIDQASKGNFVNPLSVAGSALPKVALGLASLAERNFLAPKSDGGAQVILGKPGLREVWAGVSQLMPSGGTDEDGDWSVGLPSGFGDIGELGVTGAGAVDHANEAYRAYAPEWASYPDDPEWSSDGSFGSR